MKERISTGSTEQRTFIAVIRWPPVEQRSYQLPPSPCTRTACLCRARKVKAETPVVTGDFTAVLAGVRLLTMLPWLFSSEEGYEILPA